MEKTKAILIKTDGYDITHSFFDSFENAKVAMKKQYEANVPDEWFDDFEDLSYCGDYNAALYRNGEDVFLWKIIDLKNVP